MTDPLAFAKLSPTTLADVLMRDRVIGRAAHRAKIDEILRKKGSP